MELLKFCLNSKYQNFNHVNERNNFIEFKLETDVMGSRRLTWISKDGIELLLRIYS